MRFSFGFHYRKEIFLPFISIILIVNCRKALKTLKFFIVSQTLYLKDNFGDGVFFNFLSIYRTVCDTLLNIETMHYSHAKLYKQNLLFPLSFPFLFIPHSRHAKSLIVLAYYHKYSQFSCIVIFLLSYIIF